MAVSSLYKVEELEELGLGRGINATDAAPWLNKSSFQVRHVALEDLIGTDEGSAYERFRSEINSTFTLQAMIEASITVPQVPVSIGMDTELSRSVTSSHTSVGRKVTNRTVGFRVDFDNVPKLMKQYMSEHSSDLDTDDDHAGQVDTFEERLCEWILDRVKADNALTALKDRALSAAASCPVLCSGKSPSSDVIIAQVFYHLRDEPALWGEWRDAITKACGEFVETVRVTHYVSAVQLGAAEYTILTEKDVKTALKAEASVGVDSVGETRNTLLLKY